jgi:uncharacterized membrane-anchored protein
VRIALLLLAILVEGFIAYVVARWHVRNLNAMDRARPDKKLKVRAWASFLVFCLLLLGTFLVPYWINERLRALEPTATTATGLGFVGLLIFLVAAATAWHKHKRVA